MRVLWIFEGNAMHSMRKNQSIGSNQSSKKNKCLEFHDLDGVNGQQDMKC